MKMTVEINEQDNHNPEKHDVGSGTATIQEINNRIDFVSIQKLKENFIETGFYTYDSTFGGLIPSELVIVGARPGMGLTVFLHTLIQHIAQEQPSLLLNFDLLEERLIVILLSGFSGIPFDMIVQWHIQEDELHNLSEARKKIGALKLHVRNKRFMSLTELDEYCSHMVNEHGIKVIFIDSIQALQMSFQNQEQEIGQLAARMKNLALRHNICIVSTSQLTSEVEQRPGMKRPLMSDLRGKAIDEIADKIFLLYREEYYFRDAPHHQDVSFKNKVELIIASNHSGSILTIDLMRNNDFTRMFDPHNEYDF